MNKIILASESEGRKELFTKYFGTQFETYPSNFIEKDYFHLPPQEMVHQLAQHKSATVALNFPDDFVFAFDTTISCENKNLGKPQNIEEAYLILQFLNQKIQTVWTGYSIQYKDIQTSGTECAELILSITEEEIQTYINTYPVTKFAGAYAIQKQDTNIIVKSGFIDTIIGAPMHIVLDFLKVHQYY